MITFHRVQISLFVSALSLLLFFGFSFAMNSLSRSYEAKIEQVRKEEGQAKRKLARARNTITSLRKRRDSLEVIAEAIRRPEIIWTARAVYSETKRMREMRHVAWVIRNRYESRHRGATSYRSVVLDDRQFSAFNKGYPKRNFYLSLEPKHSGRVIGWHRALRISKEVIDAGQSDRPFPESTLFFYSEHVLEERPHWEASMTEVAVKGIDERRFRFLQKSKIAYDGSHRSR